MWFEKDTRRFFTKKRFIVLCILIVLVAVLRFTLFRKVVLGPVLEHENMLLLEEVKEVHEIEPFVTDGCSGNVSDAWVVAVKGVSDILPSIGERYKTAQEIPFEYACVEHDRAYHLGEGGYVGRLKADMVLRDEIIQYAITHTSEIKQRLGLDTDEAAIFLYESIADAVYHGVRLGGAPCTGMPYAWGYGYNGGMCK